MSSSLLCGDEGGGIDVTYCNFALFMTGKKYNNVATVHLKAIDGRKRLGLRQVRRLEGTPMCELACP